MGMRGVWGDLHRQPGHRAADGAGGDAGDDGAGGPGRPGVPGDHVRGLPPPPSLGDADHQAIPDLHLREVT